MDEIYDNLYARGKELRDSVLGPSTQAPTSPPQFGDEIADMITALVYGGVWSRPGLSRRDRSLITVAIHAALGRPQEMRVHLPTAVRHGCTLEELEEVLIQVGAYAGFPNAAAARAVAVEVLGNTTTGDTAP